MIFCETRPSTGKPSIFFESEKTAIKLLSFNLYFPGFQKLQKINFFQTKMKITCSICLEEFKADELPATPPCGHLFHHLCLERWTQAKGNCPECKAPVHSYTNISRVFWHAEEEENAIGLLKTEKELLEAKLHQAQEELNWCNSLETKENFELLQAQLKSTQEGLQWANNKSKALEANADLMKEQLQITEELLREANLKAKFAARQTDKL